MSQNSFWTSTATSFAYWKSEKRLKALIERKVRESKGKERKGKKGKGRKGNGRDGKERFPIARAGFRHCGGAHFQSCGQPGFRF